jgi:hypothetical protein
VLEVESLDFVFVCWEHIGYVHRVQLSTLRDPKKLMFAVWITVDVEEILSGEELRRLGGPEEGW